MTQADSDGIPTMGEEAEDALLEFKCVCGQPMTPGVVHRTDGPCYYIEAPMNTDEKGVGSGGTDGNN